MRRKLTLTIDEDLLPQAKELASIEGTSLSMMVEITLRHLVESQGPSFSPKWKGAFSKTDKPNKKDLRQEYLSKKYL